MVDVTAAALATVTAWIPKVIEHLNSFKPEIKTMNINYRSRNAEVGISIKAPNDIRRKIQNIEIPAYQNFRVVRMMDETFTPINLEDVLQINEKRIKINCSSLPSSDRYLMSLSGTLPQESLDSIVYIQPSRSNDRTHESDKYWLNSMIKNVEALEGLWDGLNVDHVTAGVDIGIEKYISAKLPSKITRGLEAVQRWARAGYSKDREEVVKAWLKMHSIKDSRISVQEFHDLIHQLTANEFFSEFLEVDSPYNLGNIRNDESFSLFPKNMYAEACTKLTLAKPTAEGYMTFNKKNYAECIEKRFNEI